MDIAFASILIILIITPGLLFFSGFFSAPFTKEILPKNPVNELINSIIPSVLLNVIYLILIQACSTYKVDFPLLVNLLFASDSNIEGVKRSFNNISTHLYQIVSYHFGLWLSSYLLGVLSRALIRWFKLDTKYRFFRFNNHWHYLLSGEITRFPTVKLQPLRFIDMIIIDLSVSTDTETIIYTGILQEYNLNNNGELDTVTLSHALRRPIGAVRKIGPNRAVNIPIESESILTGSLSQEKAEDHDAKYWIPGNLFLLPYAKVSNINIRYITAKRSPKETVSGQKVARIRRIFNFSPQKFWFKKTATPSQSSGS